MKNDFHLPVSKLNFPYTDGSKFLSKTFENMTMSYKALWFLAILDELGKLSDDTEVRIPIANLIPSMVALAHFPAVEGRLYFGESRIASVMEQHFPRGEATYVERRKRIMRMDDKMRQNFKFITNYVPKAFISPWIRKRTPGTAPYTIDNGSLVFNKRWVCFLKQNFLIFKGFANYQLSRWLQRKNPSVPSIIEKVEFSGVRPPMPAYISQMWHLVLTEGMTCLYTGVRLVSSSTVDLDHFIPWVFMTDHQAWNIVPVQSEANGQKSDGLPDRHYWPDFFRLQYRLLSLAKSEFYSLDAARKNSAKKILRDYESAFLKPRDEVMKMDEKLFTEALMNCLEPLWLAAKNHGFEEWIFRPIAGRVES